MNVKNGNQLMDSGFEYLENIINPCNSVVELPSFLKAFKNIICGFYPGQLTVVKDSGVGNSTFIFSLLYEYVVQNDISTYLITRKYSEPYVSMNLLKYEYKDYGYRHMLSGFFNEKNLEELKTKYQETGNKRIEKGLDKEYPLYFSRFHEYDIQEICKNIAGFIQKSESKKKRLIILTDIEFNDLKVIKEMAEMYFIPIIAVFSDEPRTSSYADSEIELRVSSLHKEEGEHDTRKVPYEISAMNNITLVKSETIVELDLPAGLFI